MSVFNLCVTPGARWGLGVLERGVSTYNSFPIAILSTTMYLPANLFKFHFLVLQVLNLREFTKERMPASFAEGSIHSLACFVVELYPVF